MQKISQDCDFFFKLLIIGNPDVGKSSLLLRFSENIFYENFLPTILGIDFKIIKLYLNQKTVKLQIWDTAGQERFHTLTPSFYKCAHGIILVYDIIERQSFKDLQYWLNEIGKFANQNVVKLLVGNKSDLEEQRQVRKEEGQEMAQQLGVQFLETSAKNNINVEKVFITIAQEIQERVQNEDYIRSNGKPQFLTTEADTMKSSKGGCC